SGQTLLALKTLQQILAGSSLRLIRALLVLVIGSAAGWVILASVGRAVTLRGLLVDREPPVGKITVHSMLGLNALRAGGFIDASALSLAAIAVVANSQQDDSSAGAAIFLCLGLVVIIWLGWSAWNWYFSIAAIFVARDGCGTFPAIGKVAGLCADQPGKLFVVGLWFAFARIAAIYVAVMLCVLFIGVAPLGSAAVLAAVIASSLASFLLADFLYIGRLAAYLSVADWPLEPLPVASPVDLGTLDSGVSGQTAAVDRDELILSDLSVEMPRPSE